MKLIIKIIKSIGRGIVILAMVFLSMTLGERAERHFWKPRVDCFVTIIHCQQRIIQDLADEDSMSDSEVSTCDEDIKRCETLLTGENDESSKVGPEIPRSGGVHI